MSQPHRSMEGVSNDGSSQRASIDTFLSSLDDWGLLYVRTRMREVALRFAGLPELPPEILCLIGPLLGLKDILNCRLVSNEWCRAWTHQTVLLTLCNAYFPGLRETYPTRRPDELFFRAAANHLKWQRQGYRREIIPWKRSWSTDRFTNETPPTDPSLSRDLDSVMVGFNIQYNDGMIAWQTDYQLVIVDDLRTRTRRRCALGLGPQAGRRLQVEAVSRDLVIFVGSRRMQRFDNAVHVRHLEQKSWHTVLLPAQFAKCYIDGQRIGIVTELGQVILWSLGRGASQLNVEETRSSLGTIGSSNAFGGVPGLLLSPSRPNSVYVVWGRWHENDDAQLFTVFVVKFEGGEVVLRKEISIDRPMPAPEEFCEESLSFHVELHCKKADAYGSYNLVTFALDNEDIPDGNCKCDGWPQDNTLWGSISFNVMTETLSELHHKGPRDIKWTPGSWLDSGIIDGLQPWPLLQGLCLWNNNLLLSWHTDEDATKESGHRIVLKTANFKSPQALPNMRIHDNTVVDEGTETSFSGQLFMDDNFIVMPTRSALVVWEPGTAGGGNAPHDSMDDIGEESTDMKMEDFEAREHLVRPQDHHVILNRPRRHWQGLDSRDIEHRYHRFYGIYGIL